MFDYATQELGYSEDAAYRRLTAMRLVRELPEIESKITAGSLSLSNLGTVSQVLRAEAKMSGTQVLKERKLEMIEAVENKSRRQAESIVQQMTTAPKELIRSERVRLIDEHIEIRLTARLSLEEKIRKIKDILSHSNPNITTAELFEKLCDGFLERHSKNMEPKAAKSPANQGTHSKAGKSGSKAEIPCANPRRRHLYRHIEPAQNSGPKRRHISLAVKRQIWEKGERKCEQCLSERFLELDHIVPWALGGSDDATNLRILCRSCNQRAAIENLGQAKMMYHLEPEAGG